MSADTQLEQLQKSLGYRFKDRPLLLRCLTHVSFERKKTDGHNEVLEFLGDAVLDLAVSDLLMREYPDKSEGDLSRMRAALVNSIVLAEKAAELNLGALLRLGKGEERSDGRNKPSILAGAFEALLGGSLSGRRLRSGAQCRRTVFSRRCLGQTARPARLQDPASGNQPTAVSRAAELSMVAESGPDHEKFSSPKSASAAKCWAKAKAGAKSSPNRKRRS